MRRDSILISGTRQVVFAICVFLGFGALGGVGAYVAHASGESDGEGSPIYGVKVPAGYRDWKLIAVNNLLVPGKVDQLRAQVGNELAVKAFKEGTLPFPDGSIIVAIHWTRVPSEANDKALEGMFPGAQSFVVGAPVNIQVMVKDSKKYADTGGWGSVTSRTESRPTRRYTRIVSRAMSRSRRATLFSPVTHRNAQNGIPAGKTSTFR
ncbi:MAG: cytochrome P460 family protein [Terriglobales bacterium]